MTTEAGKRLWEVLDKLMAVMHGIATADLPENIAAASKTTYQVKAELEKLIDAIEAEAYDAGVVDQKLATLDAVTAALDALAAKVRGLDDPRHGPPWLADDHITRSAVLALIAEARR